MRDLIYLDYAATTPCDPWVVSQMTPYFSEKFGNPNSLHGYGEEAAEALADARGSVARFINAAANEIVFTSGATESNRIAVTRGRNGKTVIAAKTEHKSVFDACQETGFFVLADVCHDGMLDFDKLAEKLGEEIGLVSICMVNNETGVLNNLKKIADVCHEKDVLVHTDATQALGKIPIDVQDLNVDFLTASSHKIYGPKGIGILYYKQKHHRLLRVKNANHEVEFGIRAGTVPVSLCVGFGAAVTLASQKQAEDYGRISSLRELLISELQNNLDEIYVNGSDTSFYPGIVNVSFRGCEGEALMMEANRICVSSGSACTSNKLTISHVLDAMGIAPDIAQSSIRISIGRHTTEEEIRIAARQLIEGTLKLRAMSPVWEMIKSGVDINSVFSCRRK